MGSSSNPTATITNNSGFDLDIYDVFNPSTDSSTPGPLTYTLLASVPKRTKAQDVQTIHFASQLQAMLTGNIKALNGNYYQQFPVAVLAVSPFADSNAFTITSDMLQSMVDSFKFIKYSQANPSSQLATKFRAALGDKTSQQNAVNKFFQGTGSFKLCTMTTWTAVFTWQGQFTNPWQGTYYLYTRGSSSDKASAPALTATLAITASADNNSAVLTMADTNEESTPVVMAGDGTMQEQDQGTGNVSVVLKPAWLNVAQTSQQDGKTVSNYVIGAAFTGTINGVEVAGNLNKLSLPDPSDTSKSAEDKDKTADFWISKLESLVGVLAAVVMAYFAWKNHKQEATQKKNEVQEKAGSKEEAEARQNEVEADYQSRVVPRASADLAGVEAIAPQAQQGYREVTQAENIRNTQNTVQELKENVSEVMQESPPGPSLEKGAINLELVDNKLVEAADPTLTPAARGDILVDVKTNLTEVSVNIGQELQDSRARLSEEAGKSLEDTKAAAEEIREQTEALDKAQQEQEERNENSPEEPVDEEPVEEPDVPVEAEG
ncbi:hypothetical protein LZL87_013668 [Fusarium oxysporum]|nr:hypothetical protein LZL87_013668 [Fusarium oxysporum]